MKKLLLIIAIAIGLVTDPLYYVSGPALDPIPYPQQSHFPEKFIWGVSSASHQTEGNQNNDWAVWEQNNSARLAKNYKDCNKQGGVFCGEKTDPANYISGQAADHYEKYKQDIALAKSLKVNAYRFSLEWSRIEPKPGEFNQEALSHYRQEIQEARAAGMEPFVNIWHWTNPLWFTDQGGWCSNDADKIFQRFAEKVISEYGKEVTYWITLNEPQVYITMPYVDGRPPGTNPWCSYRTLQNLTAAHNQSYDFLKQINPLSQVGLTTGSLFFETSVSDTLSRSQQGLARFWNSYLLEQVNDKQDFIGLNYFHGGLTYGYKKKSDYVSDIGWPLYPEGLYYILKDLSKFGRPIIITENGLADSSDDQRAEYISKILKSIAAAKNEGVNVIGYFHWSLTDSFEWANGFWPRFGLAAVNYQTQERKLRPSAYYYAQIISSNGWVLNSGDGTNTEF